VRFEILPEAGLASSSCQNSLEQVKTQDNDSLLIPTDSSPPTDKLSPSIMVGSSHLGASENKDQISLKLNFHYLRLGAGG
jgi:hypothetical protein